MYDMVAFIGVWESGCNVTVVQMFGKLYFDECVQFQLPQYRKNAIKLERVQKRLTGMLPRL